MKLQAIYEVLIGERKVMIPVWMDESGQAMITNRDKRLIEENGVGNEFFRLMNLEGKEPT